MDFENILFEIDQGIGVITFNRPAVMYSLSLTLEDKVEGVNAFIEARTPKFKGR
jgi:enoyl-CoA hydratase/carnithine racemase